MDKDKKAPGKPLDADQGNWLGEVGGQTQKVRKDRGIVDPEVSDAEEDDVTLPPALRP
jgi:hypothetical protein